MNKDTKFRITRIIIILLFLTLATFLRNNLVETYENSNKLTNNIATSLKVEQLKIEDKTNDYTIKVTNYGNNTKTFTITLITDQNNTIPNENIKYEIIKDNKKIKEENLGKEGKLSKQTLKKEESSVYKIKIWLDNTKQTTDGKFSSKIALI